MSFKIRCELPVRSDLTSIAGTILTIQESNPNFMHGNTGPTGYTGPIGYTGPTGSQGIPGSATNTGATGVGIPIGGLTNQILTKVSNTDYDTQWSTLTSTRTPNTLSQFDNDGNLSSLSNWTVNSDNGLDINSTIDYQISNFINASVNVAPTMDSENNSVSILNIYSDIDPGVTNFNTGNHNLINASINHQNGGTGNVNNAIIMNSFSSFGNGNPAILNQYRGVNLVSTFNDQYTVNTVNGIETNNTFSQGSTLVDYAGIKSVANFNGTLSNFSNGINISTNCGKNSSTNTYYGISNTINGTTGSVINNYNGCSSNISNITGLAQVTGYNYYTNNLSSVNWNGISVSATDTYATNSVGLDINMTSIISPNQKVGLSISGGSLNCGYELNTSTSVIQPASSVNSIGGQFIVEDGSPLTSGEFVFGNNLAVLGIFRDNMDVDSLGGIIGFSPVAYVGQVTVSLGKTVDTINMSVAGASIPPSDNDGGTITNYSMYNALGVVPLGGNVNITNLYAYRAGKNNFLSSISPTNCWGVCIEDTGAENFFEKSISVGNSTKKVSNSDVGIEIGSKKSLLLGSLTTTEISALTPIEGMMVFDNVLKKFKGYDGTAWVSLN